MLRHVLGRMASRTPVQAACWAGIDGRLPTRFRECAQSPLEGRGGHHLPGAVGRLSRIGAQHVTYFLRPVGQAYTDKEPEEAYGL
jgi:hypothetical protein